MSAERLQKILSAAGIASRRAAEQIILEGRVTVNGHKVKELGVKADLAKDHVKVDGKLVRVSVVRRYVLMNKPKGLIVTRDDPGGIPTVFELLRGRVGERVVAVGRLDVESEGLLLLTDDGALVHTLTHPSGGCRKEYEVWVGGVGGPAVAGRRRAHVPRRDRARQDDARKERRRWQRLAQGDSRRGALAPDPQDVRPRRPPRHEAAPGRDRPDPRQQAASGRVSRPLAGGGRRAACDSARAARTACARPSGGVKGLVVAIDGPSGVGKSTVGKAVAARLGLPYLDTGAMYRAVGLAVKRKGIALPLEDREAVVAHDYDVIIRASRRNHEVESAHVNERVARYRDHSDSVKSLCQIDGQAV